MKVCFVSDTHGKHLELTNIIVQNNPDLIIHCGDATNSRNLHDNTIEWNSFYSWFISLPGHKVYVAGNHDKYCEHYNTELLNETNFHYLYNSEVTINGFRIYGSPYTPSFGNWSFMKKRNRMKDVWDLIPNYIDILVTHGPSKYHLDYAVDFDNGKVTNVGCKSLLNKILEVQPKIHCSGHIHHVPEQECYNFGILYDGYTYFINCASYNHKTGGLLEPIFLEV